jgi:hypothetical protein
MVKLGRVGLDGTKVRANASRRKAMSYDRMVRREADLAAEGDALLAEAERLDAEEDTRHGDRRGDELPDELARPESRLVKIRAAKADLEAEAAEEAAARAAERARKTGTDEDEAAEAARAVAIPKPKAQRNFTDPESRIMKTSDGSFHQCFNGQAAVDDAHQVIVAVGLSNTAPDVGHLTGMLDDIEANVGALPDKFLADAGYCSDANLR